MENRTTSPFARPVLLQAWRDLDAARRNGDAEQVWAAGVAMVDYEQRVILQNSIADTPEKRQFWTSFSNNYGDRIRAPYPGAKKFREVIPNGDYGVAEQRMQWFHHHPDGLYVKAKEWLENHPQGIDAETLLAGGYDQ